VWRRREGAARGLLCARVPRPTAPRAGVCVCVCSGGDWRRRPPMCRRHRRLGCDFFPLDAFALDVAALRETVAVTSTCAALSADQLVVQLRGCAARAARGVHSRRAGVDGGGARDFRCVGGRGRRRRQQRAALCALCVRVCSVVETVCSHPRCRCRGRARPLRARSPAERVAHAADACSCGRVGIRARPRHACQCRTHCTDNVAAIALSPCGARPACGCGTPLYTRA
jgi:hypothetical protein